MKAHMRLWNVGTVENRRICLSSMDGQSHGCHSDHSTQHRNPVLDTSQELSVTSLPGTSDPAAMALLTYSPCASGTHLSKLAASGTGFLLKPSAAPQLEAVRQSPALML